MDRTNRNTALASAMVEELARSGVHRAVVSPGSRSTPLAVALWRQPEIEVTVVLDERSAGFFALGVALATRIPAVVLCTSGSAAANLHPAVVEADEAGVPMIVLTADRPPELRGIGAGQTIDQLKLYGDAVRWFCEVGTHDADDDGLLHFRSVACRAYAAASGDPAPGPVHLNVPWREPLAPLSVPGDVTATDPLALEGRGDAPLSAVSARHSRADEALLDELADRIEAEPRGLIVAGRQPDSRLAEPLGSLAAAAGYPILAEPTSQLRRGPHDRSLL
ncbi:MAG TPA: 2-succinyl-5-enolpyruvyl-6-hydroxy-3-cyclohexene-1-carboxylic-acid synthase, partial [Solirubrobacterales bacterium]|nr:2-succinyl-5-enolpyruvyl-6-hydroxy-3-cyclohexene-1-carboxylic-acid synthase [Solirubrobacterales bacterium]